MGEFISNLLAIWWVLPVSLIIAITANTLAIEGAVIFTPAFLLLFPAVSGDFPELTANEAIGVSLLIMFFGTASASLGYVRQQVVDFRLAAKLLVITLPLAVLSRSVAFLVPPLLLFIVFGAVLFLLACIVLRSIMMHGKSNSGTVDAKNRSDIDAASDVLETELVTRDGRKYRYSARFNWLDLGLTGAGGLLVGLIGVGVGALVNTTLIIRHGLPVRIAVATTVIVVSATVLAGSMANLVMASLTGQAVAFEWSLVIMAVPGVIVGGQIAPHIAARCSELALKISLILLFAIMSSIMIVRGVVAL
jgi:uncharacterized membrane protein YfcA